MGRSFFCILSYLKIYIQSTIYSLFVLIVSYRVSHCITEDFRKILEESNKHMYFPHFTGNKKPQEASAYWGINLSVNNYACLTKHCFLFTLNKRERRLIFRSNFSCRISMALYKFSEKTATTNAGPWISI